MNQVWIVVMDQGGIFGAWLDKAHADEAARSIKGILVGIPVVADYREAAQISGR